MIAFAVLIAGYFLCGRVADRIFASDDRQTPATAYLIKKGKYRFGSLLAALPATFMSAVCMTYILTAGEGFGISTAIAVPVGIGFAAALFIVYTTLWARSRLSDRSGIEAK